MNAIIPIPRIQMSVRPGTMDDLAFIDQLQAKHTKQVGFFPKTALEGKMKLGHFLVAEENGTRIGYLMGNDQYFKRDDVGCIFQVNVAEGKRRALVGAMLLKAQFERSAYGCKLYCCWCAQDIEGNRFWESMGFVPLAFRAGSAGKQRVHIFWQKRIRAGDTTTPWWFPSQTSGGSIREDRLVFPIPPGTHWSDAKPIVLPRHTVQKQLEDAGEKTAKKKKPVLPIRKRVLAGGLTFAAPAVAKEKPQRAKKPKIKNDPKYVAAARELRDRWLERVNEDPAILEAAHSSTAKYDLSRQIESAQPAPVMMLPEAA